MRTCGLGSRASPATPCLDDLYTVWQESGIDAIRRMCAERPSEFVRAVISLVPRQVKLETESPFSDWSDAELRHLLTVLRENLVQEPAGSSGSEDQEAIGPQPPLLLPAREVA